MAAAVVVIGGLVLVPAAIYYASKAMNNPELQQARREAIRKDTKKAIDDYLTPPKRIYRPSQRTGPDPLPELSQETLKISTERGQSSTIVTIEGPAKLLERANDLSQNHTTCPGRHWASSGFSVAWGDGSFAYEQSSEKSFFGEDDCPLPLQHRYTASGNYEIKVYLWRLLPNYQTKIEWEGTHSILVDGGG